MKIFCNTNALLKQLQEFHVEAIKKMETMVETFSYNVAVQAIDNTPYGNHIAYAKFYNNWERLKWFQPIAGSAKGGWGIVIGATSFNNVSARLRLPLNFSCT